MSHSQPTAASAPSRPGTIAPSASARVTDATSTANTHLRPSVRSVGSAGSRLRQFGSRFAVSAARLAHTVFQTDADVYGSRRHAARMARAAVAHTTVDSSSSSDDDSDQVQVLPARGSSGGGRDQSRASGSGSGRGSGSGLHAIPALNVPDNAAFSNVAAGAGAAAAIGRGSGSQGSALAPLAESHREEEEEEEQEEAKMVSFPSAMKVAQAAAEDGGDDDVDTIVSFSVGGAHLCAAMPAAAAPLTRVCATTGWCPLQLFGRASKLEEEVDSVTRWCVIHPDSMGRRIWNLIAVRFVSRMLLAQGQRSISLTCMLLLQVTFVIYLTFWVPFDLAFNFQVAEQESASAWVLVVVETVMVGLVVSPRRPPAALLPAPPLADAPLPTCSAPPPGHLLWRRHSVKLSNRLY